MGWCTLGSVSVLERCIATQSRLCVEHTALSMCCCRRSSSKGWQSGLGIISAKLSARFGIVQREVVFEAIAVAARVHVFTGNQLHSDCDVMAPASVLNLIEIFLKSSHARGSSTILAKCGPSIRSIHPQSLLPRSITNKCCSWVGVLLYCIGGCDRPRQS